MSSSIGENIKITIFGQSHSQAIGVTIDNLPAGIKIDTAKLQKFLDRRAPGKEAYSTKRNEADEVQFLSGFKDGRTVGAPLTAVIFNKDTRSGDYANITDIPRPAHSDFTAFVKYHAQNDVSGGGHFSGRLTAPICIAGGICLQILEQLGIKVNAHIKSVENVEDETFSLTEDNTSKIESLLSNDFPTINHLFGERMRHAIERARLDADSVGGVVECLVNNLPVGLGDPMFDGMENRLSKIIFGIPAVKGLEFGNGFECTKLRGSVNNDEFYYDGESVKTRTNNHGGILGGITSGMPLLFRVAFKPTPSISITQNSVSLSNKEDTKLLIKGRHDPCIVPRAVPVVEAATAIAIYDAYLDNLKQNGGNYGS